jgi:predicted nucleic acid-binding protein
VNQPAFWDSSALVPLCLHQPNSEQAKALSTRFSQVVWWAARVEVFNAFARLHRQGALQPRARQEAIARLQVLAVLWDEVSPGDEVRDRAIQLLDIYPLRAADSLQLAAALVWCRERPAGRTFLCADGRLCEAAAQAGFTVLRP